MKDKLLWIEIIRGIAGIAILIALIIGLFGCAVMPDSIPVEVQHTSHISQHFGRDRTNIGWNVFFIGAKWDRGPVTLEIMDGYSPALIDNRHEVFEASVRYEFRVSK